MHIDTQVCVPPPASAAYAPGLEINQLVKSGALEAVRAVVEAGASPSKPGLQKSTPLMVALNEATTSTLEMVKLLVRSDAQPLTIRSIPLNIRNIPLNILP